MPDPNFQDQDLASWLEEAGRRRIVRKAGEPVAEAAPAAAPAASERGIYISHPRELVLFALAAVAYLPYFFADVYVQIYSMKSVVVFV